MLKKKGIILIFGILLISLASAGIYSDCEIYGTCETASDIISAINYTTVNVNNSIYWGGHPFSHLANTYVPYSGATGIVNLGNEDLLADLVWANDIQIWDDTLNADAILSMYTHDLSNSFVLTTTDAGSTDFYSTEQYQFRSGDNLFQIIHDMYTGTYLNIDVGNTFPEITSKDGVISFVDENLTTTGNITASNFFGTFNGNSSIWSRAGTNTFLTNVGDNVGIGTTTPGAKLEVLNGNIVLREDDDVNDAVKIFATNTYGGISFKLNGVTNTEIKAEGVSFFNGGNVGIGITNPTKKIEVQSSDTTLAFGNGAFEFGATANWGALKNIFSHRQDIHQIVVNEDSQNLDFRVEGDGDVNLFFTDASTDRIGIGTASLGSKLTVVGEGVAGVSYVTELRGPWNTIKYIDTSAQYYWQVGDDTFTTAKDFRITGPSNVPMYLVMRGATGNVGVNIAIPESRFEVKGTGTTSSTSALDITNSLSESMLFVRDDGNVGIGTTTPQNKLNVIGDGNFTGSLYLGNLTATGGALFKGAILGDTSLGYENIRFGVYSHTPRIIFDNGTFISQIDYVGNTMRFIFNETGVGNRVTMRINNSAVRIGEAGRRRNLYLYGDLIGINPAGGGANIIMDGYGNFTGNVTADNVFLHAEIFVHTLSSQTVLADGQWVNITFDELTDIKKRITHVHDDNTNDTFIIQDTGTYDFKYSIKVQDTTVVGSDVGFRIISNGVEIEGSYAEIDIDKKDIDRYSNGFVVAKLTEGDEIKMQFTSNSTTTLLKTDGTFSDHDDTAKIEIRRIS